jgi:hypothetical protein
MRSVVLSILIAASAVTVSAATRAVPCKVSPSILEVYRYPTSASSAEWVASRKAVSDLMLRSCEAAGPEDRVSRATLFALLEKEMNVDYQAVFATWQKRNAKPLSESASEGVLYFQRDLLTYIDQIVSPRDVQHADAILEYANGLAISKLGSAVKDRVVQQAGMRPKAIYGLVQQNRQEEAFRAIGYWLDPSDPTFTPAEKRRHALELTGILPGDGLLRTDLHMRLVTTVVEALAHSDEAEVEEKLRAWRHRYENANGTGDTIAEVAQMSADRIRSRVQAKSKSQ